MARLITVHTLTFSPTPETIHDATLLFKTLRVGFASARVRVVDNNSCPEAVAEIERLGAETGCEVRRLTSGTRHYAFLSDVVMNPEHVGTTVIVDPRIIFWANCEAWQVERLIAGRLVPSFLEKSGGHISLPRLHPSFWWIRDVAAMRERILRDYRRSGIGYLDAFAPYMFRDHVSGVWYRFDTGANLYAACKEDSYCFTERELDCFDHLMPHNDVETLGPAFRSTAGGMRDIHATAGVDYAKLKGLWKAQEAYFRSRAVPSVAELVFGR